MRISDRSSDVCSSDLAQLGDEFDAFGIVGGALGVVGARLCRLFRFRGSRLGFRFGLVGFRRGIVGLHGRFVRRNVGLDIVGEREAVLRADRGKAIGGIGAAVIVGAGIVRDGGKLCGKGGGFGVCVLHGARKGVVEGKSV